MKNFSLTALLSATIISFAFINASNAKSFADQPQNGKPGDYGHQNTDGQNGEDGCNGGNGGDGGGSDFGHGGDGGNGGDVD